MEFTGSGQRFALSLAFTSKLLIYREYRSQNSLLRTQGPANRKYEWVKERGKHPENRIKEHNPAEDHFPNHLDPQGSS